MLHVRACTQSIVISGGPGLSCGFQMYVGHDVRAYISLLLLSPLPGHSALSAPRVPREKVSHSLILLYLGR